MRILITGYSDFESVVAVFAKTPGLERVMTLNPEDWDYGHIWPFLFVFYLVGLMIARKRYQ